MGIKLPEWVKTKEDYIKWKREWEEGKYKEKEKTRGDEIQTNIAQPVDNLIKCISCDSLIPREINFCPQCGRPQSQIITVEKTSKKWKKFMLYGAIGIIFGLFILPIAFRTESNILMMVSILPLLGGIVILILAKAGAWWYHG